MSAPRIAGSPRLPPGGLPWAAAGSAVSRDRYRTPSTPSVTQAIRPLGQRCRILPGLPAILAPLCNVMAGVGPLYCDIVPNTGNALTRHLVALGLLCMNEALPA